MKNLMILARQSCALAVTCVALSSLMACGGGGGDSGDGSTTTPGTGLQGYWSDSTSVSLITSDNEVWGIDTSASELILTHGYLSTSGASFNGALDFYRLSTTGKVTLQTSGTFMPRTSMTGTVVSSSGTSSNYTFRYDATYEQPATLAQAAGTWQATVTVGSRTTQHTSVVSGDGKMTFTSRSWVTGSTPSTSGCGTTGTLTPDPAGGNFYRIAGKFASTGCATPNASIRGYVTISGKVMMGAVLWSGEGMPFALTRS